MGVVVLVVVLVFVQPRGTTSAAPDGFVTTEVRWQASSRGAAAVSYLVRIQEVGSATEDTFAVAARPDAQQSFAFTRARPGRDYRACIAGVDAKGRQGPWSDWSPVYRRDAAATQP